MGVVMARNMWNMVSVSLLITKLFLKRNTLSSLKIIIIIIRFTVVDIFFFFSNTTDSKTGTEKKRAELDDTKAGQKNQRVGLIAIIKIISTTFPSFAGIHLFIHHRFRNVFLKLIRSSIVF